MAPQSGEFYAAGVRARPRCDSVMMVPISMHSMMSFGLSAMRASIDIGTLLSVPLPAVTRTACSSGRH